jgi:hypothetical protein
LAKRKTLQQKTLEKELENSLNDLGKLISKDASKNSKVLTGDLRDSQNYKTRPYNVLTVSQNIYGKDLFLRGKYSGEKNALMVSIEKNLPEGIDLIVQDMVDLLISPIVKK